MSENKPFLSVGAKDWIQAFWTFLISTAISIIGDALLQALSSGTYSVDQIHWREVGAAISVAVITYIQKNFFRNSDGKMFKKESADLTLKEK